MVAELIEDNEPEIELTEELMMELLEDSEATEYTIETNIDDNAFRLQFHNEDGVLSSFTTDSGGAYDLAQRIMRAYDKLEGL
jgi:hypothetical protein